MEYSVLIHNETVIDEVTPDVAIIADPEPPGLEASWRGAYNIVDPHHLRL